MSSPLNRLAGKVAIVTGASRGIGKAIALQLGSLGANVVVNYASSSSAAEEVVEKIGKDRAISVKADTSKISEIEKLVATTIQKFGKVDILIPNAGSMPMRDLAHTTEEDFDGAIALNVKGPYFLAQKVAPHMQSGSHIIFISTSLCVASGVAPGYLLYNTTKGAIEQMTRVMCKDLGPKGIYVNAIAPGPTGTDLYYKGKPEAILQAVANSHPQKRIATVDEIAENVVFLAASRWVSGQVVRVNGGMA
ncbi:hypothetical protein CHGG_02131 [Paecilomyces variotii No. 5]|uniref:Uncharacterized protein n=1 Tax=Byssochlamys spectabilis (strain No. 5 / NBRC 109023) TaxID=1356009 RepID=V5HV16_BYSSN|nr:hypothetical protein CHGG_02131 [Paecilomyces variotii No. 5]